MATPQYTDYGTTNQNLGGVAGDYIEQQRTRTTSGIRNVEATVGNRTRKATERGIQSAGRRTARVGKRIKEQALWTEEAGQPGLTTAAMKRSGELIHTAGRIVNAASRGYVFKSKVSRTVVGWAIGVASAFTVISYPIGIIALAAIGATGAITYLPGGETIVETIIWFTTGSSVDIWVFAMMFYVFHFFFTIATYLTVYTMLKFGGVQPLHGRASGLKNLALLATLVITLIPGTNFIPWIWGWLFVVWLYPN